MSSRPCDFEVAVIGGGPGGSTTATALARNGRRVVLFESERLPRFHIGESQLPWINEALARIGARDLIVHHGFVEKWGASFTDAEGDVHRYADFSDSPETPQPQTWQVPRAEFDRLLLEHCAACGVDVRQQHRVVDIAFDSEGVELSIERSDGGQDRVRAALVVDASGRSSLLAKRFGDRRMDPLLRNVAVHAQFEGVPRREGRRAGDIQMVTRPDRGWFWFIPLSETVMSVGAVIPQAVHGRCSRASADLSLAFYLAETKAAAALVQSARRITPARFDADYSYLAAQHAGDRFLLVGDAGAFLDPIFSTGVLLAMQGGLDAADAIDAGLKAGDLRRARFRRFERQVVRRYRHFRRFAVGFYDPAFRELFFSPGRSSLYRAVVSVLAGNWRPSLALRLRLRVFFALVALQRSFAIAPRLYPAPEVNGGADA
jgi:flavin-dependent dehydrogenase